MRRGIFFLFFTSLISRAVEIGFFVQRDASGKIVYYEDGNPYSHVAIRVGNQWLEAVPYYGVHLTDHSQMGELTDIMEDDSIPEPGVDFLNAVLGKKYFIFADWDDPNTYHCGKLVAKYLGISPEPIVLDHDIWGDRFDTYIGKPGLSPSQLKDVLTDRDYENRPQPSCLERLK